ncbi:hypothetical protein [Streptomyces sp. NBC_00847]|uniref:hypothetical protein n=1 Tax=Streptomyces sp. NBC_00847 TaxID=2975850 RepID=UPI00225E4288|nr:hypothetical protein [Streptomyces sp. NBC_00847]MCX4885947.1 hypothetical protein [Streptomyces sp. NBC_00847]
MSGSRRKVPPPIPVVGSGEGTAGQSREDELLKWEEAERARREQAAVGAPVPSQAPPTAVPAGPSGSPEAAPAQPAGQEASVTVVREVTGYLEVPAFAEPDSQDPGERLEFYSRGVLAVQYAARANHERVEQQKLIGLGLRLQAMKDEELHKVAGFDTFGELTEARFGIKKHQANNIIRVTPVAQALEDLTTQELKERPLRVLVPVLDTHGVEAVRATWVEAARHGNVTDKSLMQAANFLGYAPPKELAQASEGTSEPRVLKASESLKAVERIRMLAETDRARARREAEELESAVRELLEELDGDLGVQA